MNEAIYQRSDQKKEQHKSEIGCRLLSVAVKYVVLIKFNENDFYR